MGKKNTSNGDLLKLTKLQSTFPEVKWKLFKQARKNPPSARSSLCTWGLNWQEQQLSREFICSHGNPQSSLEKNVGIWLKTCPACSCSRAENYLCSLSALASHCSVTECQPQIINSAQNSMRLTSNFHKGNYKHQLQHVDNNS